MTLLVLQMKSTLLLLLKIFLSYLLSLFQIFLRTLSSLQLQYSDYNQKLQSHLVLLMVDNVTTDTVNATIIAKQTNQKLTMR